MKALLLFLLRALFRYRTFNTGVLDTPGPVLLVPNHVSWLDWLFLGIVLSDDWKFVVSSTVAGKSWLHNRIMVNRRTFPVDVASPYAVRRMTEYLQQGGRLVLFAEGQITRTGTLMKLFDGTGFLLLKSKAKVITCYLRGANRIRWSRQPGWRRLFPQISVYFSDALQPPHPGEGRASLVRTRITNWLRDVMVHQQFTVEMNAGPRRLPDAIIEAARATPSTVILQDATMQELTYHRFLVGADLLASKLDEVLTNGSSHVGVLLPNVNATPVTIMALWALGKTPAMLNFSTGTATMLACAKLSGIKQILTSKQFLTRAKLDLAVLKEAGVDILYLEDVRARVKLPEKLKSLVKMRWAPHYLMRNISKPADTSTLLVQAAQEPRGNPADSTAVILFTSGSEGVPKGVELSHKNLLSNIRQALAVTDLTDEDRVFNAMPLFHSFGLTVGTLLGLVRGLYVFLYPSPLHYRLVPAVLYDRYCTVFLGTNTFLNGYARRAHPYDFRSLRYLFAAAEKIQEETFRVWSQRFGIRLLEGYGATECSPCISVNTPLSNRIGSAGRLLPGLEYRIEPVEGVSEGGRLLVRGPSVMKGYLNPDANAKFQALEGWYDTGDIVQLDEDGFLYIKGRLKRFAKISGEMVSLAAVEDALAGAFPQYGARCTVAVLTRPDPDKGELLIAVSNEPKLTLEEMRAAIKAKGLTNLCVPREIKYLREIPKLGTGKIDYRTLQSTLVAS